MYSTIQSSISRGSERKQGKYLLSKISRKCVHGRKRKHAYTRMLTHTRIYTHTLTHTQTNNTIHWDIRTVARSLQKREPNSSLISPSLRAQVCWHEKQINKDGKKNKHSALICLFLCLYGLCYSGLLGAHYGLKLERLHTNACLVLATLYLFNKRERLIERRAGLSQNAAHPSQTQTPPCSLVLGKILRTSVSKRAAESSLHASREPLSWANNTTCQRAEKSSAILLTGLGGN